MSMKANELSSRDLMIGDWLMHANGTPMQVKKIVFGHFACAKNGGANCWEYNNKFEPIPITPEILEKNGFDVVRGNRIMGLQVSDRCTLRIGDGMKEMRVEMQNWGETEERKWFIEIRNLGSIILQLYIGYIHELQHALRLCKIEKEIIL